MLLAEGAINVNCISRMEVKLTHGKLPVGEGTEMKRDQIDSGGLKAFPTLIFRRMNASARIRPSTKTTTSSMPIVRLFSQRIQTRNMSIVSTAPKLTMERNKKIGGRRHAYSAESMTCM